MSSQIYLKHFVKDLPFLTEKTLLDCTGIIISVKVSEKIITIIIDDSTGTINCWFYKNDYILNELKEAQNTLSLEKIICQKYKPPNLKY